MTSDINTDHSSGATFGKAIGRGANVTSTGNTTNTALDVSTTELVATLRDLAAVMEGVTVAGQQRVDEAKAALNEMAHQANQKSPDVGKVINHPQSGWL